jgi:hypothetical protein
MAGLDPAIHVLRAAGVGEVERPPYHGGISVILRVLRVLYVEKSASV